MPKRVSDEIDHVPVEPPAKKHKTAPPDHWQLPKFKPQAITGAPTHGYGSLPDNASLEGSSWCDSVMVELAGQGLAGQSSVG